MIRVNDEINASAIELASTSLWGHMSGFIGLPIMYASIMVGMLVAYFFFVGLAYQNFWDVLNVRAFLRETAWWGAQILYVPACLAFSRLFPCETLLAGEFAGQSRLSVDPSFECGGAAHVLAIIVFTPFLVVWLLGVPAGIAYHVSSSLVFPPSKPHRHERFLRWKESEYAFGITLDWRREHMWMFSSFRRRWWHPYNRAIWYSIMGVNIMLFTVLRSSPALQASLFFLVIFCWTMRMILLPAYRVGTSSALAFIVWAAASFNSIYSVVRANGVVSALTIDSEYFAFMRGVNLFLFTLAVIVLAVAASPAFTWPRGMVGGHQWRSLSGFSGHFFNPKESALYTFRGQAANNALNGKPESSRNPYMRTASVLRRAMVLGSPSRRIVPAEALDANTSTDDSPRKLPPSFALAIPNRESAKVAPTIQEGDEGGEGGDDESAPLAPAGVPDLGLGGGLHGTSTAPFSADGEADVDEVGITDAQLDELLAERDFLDFGDAPESDSDSGDEEIDAAEAAAAEAAKGMGERSSAGGVPTFTRSVGNRQANLRGRNRANVNRAISLQGGKRRREGWTGWCETKGWYLAEFLGCAVEAGDVDPHTGQAKYLCCPWLRHGKQATSTAASLGQAGLLMKSWSKREYLTTGARSTPLRKWFSVLPGRSANTSVRISQLQLQRLLTPDDVAELEMRWMLGIKAAKSLVRRSQRIPPELVDCRLVRRLALALRMEHRMARRMRHVLAYSLQDTLDELAVVIDRCAPVSIFPNEALERLLPGLVTRMEKREKQMALVDPRLRRMLLKLFALKAWMGQRPIKASFPQAAYMKDQLSRRGMNGILAGWLTRADKAEEEAKPVNRLVRRLSRRDSMRPELQLLARAQAHAKEGGTMDSVMRERGYVTYTRQQLSSMAYGGASALAAVRIMAAMDLLLLTPDASLFIKESTGSIHGDFGTELKRRVLSDTRKRAGMDRCKAVLALAAAVRDRWRVILVQWEKSAGDPGCVPALLDAVSGGTYSQSSGLESARGGQEESKAEGGAVLALPSAHLEAVNTVQEAMTLLTGLNQPDSRLVLVWYDAYLSATASADFAHSKLDSIIAGLMPQETPGAAADGADALDPAQSAREAAMPKTLQRGGAARFALGKLINRVRAK